jgi:hypothetical protein
MKKNLIALLLAMLAAPVMAEDPISIVKDMGYTQDFIFEHVARSRKLEKFMDPKPYVKPDYNEDRPTLNPNDFLHPRVFQKGESAEVIPLLMKLQKKNPTSVRLTRKLALTCLKNGQDREALYWFLQTYLRDRSDLESLWNMAALSYKLRENDQTEKYLAEYVHRDPNSAWGRMAREFLKGQFAGNDPGVGFRSEFSRVGSSKTEEKIDNILLGKERKVEGPGIMVIEGERTSFGEYMTDGHVVDSNHRAEVTAQKKDASKGKVSKAVLAEKQQTAYKRVTEVKSKAPLKEAKILPGTDNKAVTTTAPPLTKP